ncbi:phenylacetate-coenzyme A ligase [Micromonospora qiuiae]|uniref:Phenylacetate-coenzyme A ligase n=2 Tax=Micromonospora qiuiae TaxID=502268 RepID=A0ABQ4JGZ6_9ACTN|nr:phenylacetate-coenzyme A ligase [Micromonospora qiuiae]
MSTLTLDTVSHYRGRGFAHTHDTPLLIRHHSQKECRYVVIAPWLDFMTRWNEGKVTAAELTDWQTTALRAVLGHVHSKSPFYRRRLAGVNLDIKDLADLAHIPYTTKDDLRDAMHGMLSGTVADAQFYFETTGTTGRPTPCPRSAMDFDLNVAPLAHALDLIVRKHFTDDGERPILAVVAPNDVHAACLSLSFAAKQIGIAKLDLFPITPTLGFARFFEVLVELRINMILCSPGLLMALAEMSSSYGVEVPDDLAVKVLLTTGEMCSDGMGRLLAQTWNADVYNFMYGSQEAGCPAVTRPDGTVVAIEPTYLLEVLDLETETTLGIEGYGELCLTTLVPGLKPLIRYRTGDLVSIAPDSTGRRTVKVLGRVKDMTDLGGRKRSAAEIDNTILADPELIYGYELEVHAVGGQDRVHVRVKAKEGADHDQLKALVAGRVTAAFGVPAEVTIHPLLDLKSATGGWVSWKTARIKDRRAQETDDIETRSAADLARAVEQAI